MNRGLLTFLTIWLGFMLALSAWTFASPVASGPDENAHFVKAAATVRNEGIGAPTDSPDERSYAVPRSIADILGSPSCFQGHTERPADCQKAITSSTAGPPVRADIWVAGYNPLYYYLVGWPTLLVGGTAGLLLVELLSALLCSFLLAAGIWATTSARRPRVALAAASVAITPMVLFLGSRLNPNSVEICGSLAVALLAFSLVRQESARPVAGRLALLTICGALTICARATSPAFIVAALVLAAVVSAPGALRRLWSLCATRVSLAVLLAATLFSGAWTLAAGVLGGFLPATGPHDAFPKAFVVTLRDTPHYFYQSVGDFGWLDVPTRPALAAAWAVLALVLVVAAFVRGSVRHRGALVLALLAYLLFGPLVQGAAAAQYGYIWQGRYSLPLFCVLLATAGAVLSQSLPRQDRAIRMRVPELIIAATGLLQLYGFAVAIRRYTVGTSRPFVSMLTGPEWSPAVGILPCFAFLVAGGLLIALVTRGRAIPYHARTDLAANATQE